MKHTRGPLEIANEGSATHPGQHPPLLCRLGLHRWEWLRDCDGNPRVSSLLWQRCRRCGKVVYS